MKPNLTTEEANILYYRIENFELTHSDVIKWAYNQFENDGVLSWIEEITLTTSMVEVKVLLREEFIISQIKTQYLLGETAYKYYSKMISYDVAANLTYEVLSDDDMWDEKDIQDAYIMDDYFDWHENPKEVVIPILDKLLGKHQSKYMEKFNMFGALKTFL